MEDLKQDHLSQMNLQIDNEVRQQLYEAAKWTKFISIVMFVACGFILLFGTLGGQAIYTALKRLGRTYDFITEFDAAILIAVIVLVVAVIVLIYYFMFNFSRKIKIALISESTTELNEGLKSLKIFFIITTVFSILSLISTVVGLFN